MPHQLLTNKSDIDAWLARYGVNNASVVPNSIYGHTVFVNGNVDLAGKGLKSIDVKFSKIRGWFAVSNNFLTSLLGCPDNVEGSFLCNSNELVNLKHGPGTVLRDYICSENSLTSLEGCPQTIGGYFNCSLNKLTNLKHGPISTLQGYRASYNELDSLEFFPLRVGTNIDLEFNPELLEVQKVKDFRVLTEIHIMHRDVVSVKKALESSLSLPSNLSSYTSSSTNKI